MKKILMTIALSVIICSQSMAELAFSYRDAEAQIQKADSLIKENKIKEAHSIIFVLRPKLAEITEMHAQIYEALKDDTKAEVTADKERQITIEYAKLRDMANYYAGVLSRKQGNEMEAVKHFVLVVQSQRTTGLGAQAYKELREMGFSPTLRLEEQ